MQGRILEVVGEEGECRVLYDDDMQERLTLPRERFRWLAPRARSAGATPALYVRTIFPLSSALCSMPTASQVLENISLHGHMQALDAYPALIFALA